MTSADDESPSAFAPPRSGRRSAEPAPGLRPRRLPEPHPPAAVFPAVPTSDDVQRYYLCCEEPSGEFVEVIIAITDGGRRRYFATSDGERLSEVDGDSFARRSEDGARSLLELDAREMAELEAELRFVRSVRGRDPLAELEAASGADEADDEGDDGDAGGAGDAGIVEPAWLAALFEATAARTPDHARASFERVPEPVSESELEPDPELESEPEPEPEPEAELELESQPQPRPQLELELEPDPEPQLELEPTETDDARDDAADREDDTPEMEEPVMDEFEAMVMGMGSFDQLQPEASVLPDAAAQPAVAVQPEPQAAAPIPAPAPVAPIEPVPAPASSAPGFVAPASVAPVPVAAPAAAVPVPAHAAPVAPFSAPAASVSAPGGAVAVAELAEADAAAFDAVPQVALAQGIAFVAHRGQLDRTGAEYIDHPGRVAEQFEATVEPIATAAAWLHDVLGESELTAHELLAAGVLPEVVEIVELLTRTPDVSEADYYARIRAHEIARRVKLADVADNSAPWRVRKLDFAEQARLAEKYRHAREALSA